MLTLVGVFFLVQCVLLKRFTITIRERKENSLFFVRAASYSGGKEFILFLFIKNGPVTALRKEAQEHLGDSGHSYHG